jgi:hypothetical protein
LYPGPNTKRKLDKRRIRVAPADRSGGQDFNADTGLAWVTNTQGAVAITYIVFIGCTFQARFLPAFALPARIL